ncbi:ABC transporter ATP-binding protein [Candidatus Protochlamydia sp. W-9]|uniref:ABC transporter ATP-binding protein n=1 Tax=Candidatus Protochlamydia sp. W-9 TaxID=1785087 RepID=UPI00096A98B8|nr:ATP-binding cassette domain-containing protein [Candidatus Protochlamydia sp. W-9]
MIEIKDVSKNYTIFKRRSGLINTFKSLFKRDYETVFAVKKISFYINKGEFVGFIGPNGAGKTTTLKMLSGILHPTKGEILVNGFIPYDRKPEFLKNIAFITARKNNLWWDIPAIDSFLINKVIYEIDDSLFKKRVKELSNMLDVENLLDVPVRNLSLGERMKLEIIMSLLHNPKLIFLDEPTIGLDFISRQKIRKFLINYQTINQATIILTSHYFEDIIDLCKRIIIIKDGELILDESLSNIQIKYKDYKIVRIRSENLENYKKQYKSNIIDENMEFIEIMLTHNEIINHFNKDFDGQFEIKPVSLEAMVKGHYENF